MALRDDNVATIAMRLALPPLAVVGVDDDARFDRAALRQLAVL